MKELKFRQWESARGIMYYGIGMQDDIWNSFPSVSWKDSPAMQCTGVPEEYETTEYFPEFKEIYEADILEVAFDTSDRSVTAIGIVAWNDNGYWAIDFLSYSMPLFDANITSKKIIGNDFENPTLYNDQQIPTLVTDIENSIIALAQNNWVMSDVTIDLLKSIIAHTNKLVEEIKG